MMAGLTQRSLGRTRGVQLQLLVSMGLPVEDARCRWLAQRSLVEPTVV